MISLQSIVDSGLCIGCGLCRAIAPDAIEISMTELGVERPVEIGDLDQASLALINQVCPGLVVVSRPEIDANVDPRWGPVRRLARGFASDSEVRFRAATGGVLTALGRYLLSSGRVERVLHVAPDPDDGLRWTAHVSEHPDDVMAGAGSRYGPVAALTPLVDLIDDGAPLAVIAKPCDLAAVRNLITTQPAGAAVVRYLLAMACGGTSRMTKSWALLSDFGVADHEVASLRHRGDGNPGPTRVVTKDGRTYETSYAAMWADEQTWDLQWRCKVCPDGMGEVADLVALDCWPGGVPSGEDAGYNGIIARTVAGADLLAAAVSDGVIELDMEDLPVDESLERWQPHQSRRKSAVSSRLRAMAAEGLPVLRTEGLRLDEAERRLTSGETRDEFEGAVSRIRRGVDGEPRRRP